MPKLTTSPVSLSTAKKIAKLNGVSSYSATVSTSANAKGFDAIETSSASQGSGGQQQRVAIARTMVCDAPLVVADEPTGNLDEENTDAVIALFQQIAHEQNKCVIIVTHEPDVAAQCDATIRLEHKQFTWEKKPV